MGEDIKNKIGSNLTNIKYNFDWLVKKIKMDIKIKKFEY